MRDQLTEAEFDALKQELDTAILAIAKAFAEKNDMPLSEVYVHISGGSKCYCACPSGPCQHDWTGLWVDYGNGGSVTCARCNQSAMQHSLRTSE
jgi:Zn-finger protein